MKQVFRRIVYVFTALFILDIIAVVLLPGGQFFLSFFSSDYPFRYVLFIDAWRFFEVLVIIYAFMVFFEKVDIKKEKKQN